MAPRPARMTLRRLKQCCYGVAAVNTVAAAYSLNYLFFYLRDRYGFANRGNLLASAVHGGVYIFAAWNGGRFAERRGYLTSLAAGFAGLSATTAVAYFVTSAPLQVALLVPYTIALLLIWPALEALVTSHEPEARVPHMVGVYNLTWSSAQALAYFTGGPLYDLTGRYAVFVVPSVLFLAQGVLVLWLKPRADAAILALPPQTEPATRPHDRPRGRLAPRVFLRLAWIANPFAYMAMYTVFAVMPALATRLGLSPTRVGLFCSVWLFSRVVAFAVLWAWPGWHYRFRWMAASFLVVIVTFAAILVAPTLEIIVAAQVFFGLAAGLIYYSSLFYAMDAGEAKGEHGGLHEAAIGIGICAGPAIGALSLQIWPLVPRANAAAVTVLLTAGFAAFVATWARARRAQHSHA